MAIDGLPATDNITAWKQTQERYASAPLVESIVFQNDGSNNTISNPRPHKKTVVHFYNTDCIEIGRRLCLAAPGTRVAILNMADWVIPGGLVESGAPTQEEELFRRSNLHKHLTTAHYPMKQFQIVLSRRVEFYRGAQPYFKPHTPFCMDVLSAAAPRYPELDKTGRRFGTVAGEEFMLGKIRGLLATAYNEGIDFLILSAWGCGAFGCPVSHVARLFAEVVAEFDGCFRGICFAILGSNYALFKKAYELGAMSHSQMAFKILNDVMWIATNFR